MVFIKWLRLKDGQVIPKIKISDNVEKVTNPGMKNLNRIMDKETGMAIADLLTLEDEVIDTTQDLTTIIQCLVGNTK